MHKFTTIAFLSAVMVIPAFAARKLEGDTTLKDSQPVGTTNKHQKHNVYDLIFNAAGNEYTCRTAPNKSMNATDFVVGTGVHYGIDGKTVKIKTPNDKKVECTIVRVAVSPAP